jgi:hypothetical protein
MDTHADYIRRKLDLLWDYLRACEFQGLSPLRYTVGMLARQIREYRMVNKFYDCV